MDRNTVSFLESQARMLDVSESLEHIVVCSEGYDPKRETSGLTGKFEIVRHKGIPPGHCVVIDRKWP